MAYITSELYKEAIEKESRVTFIDGKIKTVGNVTIPIENKSIDSGSFYITNQCVSSDAFAYGSVFAAEAGITLKTEIDRYSLYDAEIELFFNILLSNNEYERIPLGKFYINEPSRVGKNISIKAYDSMINLDKDIEEDTTGTPFDLLYYISQRCNVELAQTVEEIEALVNGDKLLSVVASRIETYRDLLSQIALATCSFAIIDREGKLRLCQYGTESVKTIQAKSRTTSKFSDFETYYTSVIASFITDSAFKKYVCISETGNEGLLYDLGEVSVIQGLDETNQAALDNIFANLSAIRYVPCDFSFNGDPSLDLGDMITSIDRFGNEITSLITFYKWSYRGGHQIKSAGSNPRLASAKEKKSADLSSIQADIKAKTVSVYTYTNAKKYSVKGGTDTRDMDRIVQIAFAANEETISLFVATVTFEMDYDGFVELQCYLDGFLYENSVVGQYCNKGHNTISFMNYIPCNLNTTYRLEVYARTYYTESDLRVNTAKISTNENARNATILAYESLVSVLKEATEFPLEDLNDTIEYDVVSPITNVPTMSIQKFNVKAAIFGQGLAGEVDWDGTITFEEVLGKISIPTLKPEIKSVIDDVYFGKQEPSKSRVSESIGKISLSRMSPIIKGYTVSVGHEMVVTNYTVETTEEKLIEYEYNSEYVETTSGFSLRQEYEYCSEDFGMNGCKACCVKIITDDKVSIESLEVVS